VGELRKRVLSALFGVPVVLLVFYFFPPRWFFFFLAFVALVAFREVFRMARLRPVTALMILAAGSFVPLYLNSLPGFVGWLFLSIVLFVPARLVLPPRGPEDSDMNVEIVSGVAALLIAHVFIVLPLYHLYLLKVARNLLPLVLLLSIWSSDTCAYFVGKNFGKHPLVPLVSPKKTCEGLLGAVAGSALVIVLARGTLGMGLLESLGLGAMLGILGQLGDIFESAGKRACNLKDSSAMIPGHGGLLDRIDSFIFTAPFFYLYLSGTQS
jgi:phosphatidate cytidylyltransferase